MARDGNSCAEASVTFLQQVRANHPEPLIVIRDNGPAHGGDDVKAYLATPDLALQAVRLPAYSPDFNPAEAIWAWAREEVTANTCLGTKAKVQAKMTQFFAGLQDRTAEAQSRCRRTLHALTEAHNASADDPSDLDTHVVLTCASV